jgi:hypothetical protein
VALGTFQATKIRRRSAQVFRVQTATRWESEPDALYRLIQLQSSSFFFFFSLFQLEIEAQHTFIEIYWTWTDWTATFFTSPFQYCVVPWWLYVWWELPLGQEELDPIDNRKKKNTWLNKGGMLLVRIPLRSSPISTSEREILYREWLLYG